MSKHTPGPWTMAPKKPGTPFTVRGPGFTLLALTPPMDSEVAEANARLMSAAPELLTELRSMVIDCCGQPLNMIGCGGCLSARMVIAKAEGRE